MQTHTHTSQSQPLCTRTHCPIALYQSFAGGVVLSQVVSHSTGNAGAERSRDRDRDRERERDRGGTYRRDKRDRSRSRSRSRSRER